MQGEHNYYRDYTVLPSAKSGTVSVEYDMPDQWPRALRRYHLASGNFYTGPGSIPGLDISGF